MPPKTKKRGAFIVLNPNGIPKGRHILRVHKHGPKGRDQHPDKCEDRSFYEGDEITEADFLGFSIDRYFQHVDRGKGPCDDKDCKLERCAGPYLKAKVTHG